MPHDAKYLDKQFSQRHALELKQAEEKTVEQFAAINAVMAARRKAGCRSLTCVGCGNEDCVKAAKEYQKQWPEEKQTMLNQTDHVSRVFTPSANTQKRESSPSAKSQPCREPSESNHPGRPASGSGLFDLQDQK